MIRRLREEFAKPWARTTTTSVFILSVLTNVLTLTGVWDRFIAPAIWPPRADVNMVCKAISYMTDDELLSQPSRVDQMVMLGDSGALVRPASAYSGNSLVFLNMFQGVAPFANFNNDRTPVYPAAEGFSTYETTHRA